MPCCFTCTQRRTTAKFPKFPERSSNQRYIMFIMESPLSDFNDYKQLPSFFNWTMTYRTDSDIPVPYGWISSKEDLKDHDHRLTEWLPYESSKVNRNFLAQFRRPRYGSTQVAWIVSNCQSRSQRELYVHELTKYIDVDVFGKCNNKSCNTTCMKHIEENYMFYLSFENSICQDYVTEKFWKVLESAMVPIVLGGADYTKFAPPHSYIDATEWKPKDLAGFLLELIENEDEYLSYFWWKEHYMVIHPPATLGAPTMCKLCEMLNDSKASKKVYNDIDSWWNGTEQCKPNGSFYWSHFNM